MKIKMCVVCGKPFEAVGNAKCCSAECSAKERKELKITHQKRERERVKKYGASNSKGKRKTKRDGNKSLVAKNKEARALGMSYGQYAAREAAAAVKVDINIGGNEDVGNRKES